MIGEIKRNKGHNMEFMLNSIHKRQISSKYLYYFFHLKHQFSKKVPEKYSPPERRNCSLKIALNFNIKIKIPDKVVLK